MTRTISGLGAFPGCRTCCPRSKGSWFYSLLISALTLRVFMYILGGVIRGAITLDRLYAVLFFSVDLLSTSLFYISECTVGFLWAQKVAILYSPELDLESSWPWFAGGVAASDSDA